ncbi:hypothetical protein, partial [Coprobacter fastidiosus]|uniref:hypothetical protein n=1 Tax=Coprobacter fastidiosus TaxID=1099853 RepID=UPI003AB89A03
ITVSALKGSAMTTDVCSTESVADKKNDSETGQADAETITPSDHIRIIHINIRTSFIHSINTYS